MYIRPNNQQSTTTMLLTLPSGKTVNIPNSTPDRGAYATAAYPPTVANSGLMGAVTAGTVNTYINETFGTLLVYSQTGAIEATERMDDNAAVTTALSQINAALAGGCAAGTLASTGNLTWAAPGS